MPAAAAIQTVFGPDPTRAYGGLTAQQYAYCQARASGMNKTNAYRQAFELSDDHTDRRALELAYMLEAKPHIVSTINDMVVSRGAVTPLVPKVTRDFVLEGIVAIATKETAKDNVRLRAYELLGRVRGVDLFRDDTPSPSAPRSIEDIDRELKERLSQMITVDGEARRVEPVNQDAVNANADQPVNHDPVKPTRTERIDRRRKPRG